MAKLYSNYIDGNWNTSASGSSFPVHNPAHSGELVGTFQQSDASDVRAAVDAACRAQQSWAQTPAPKRADFLRKAAAILARRRDEAATLLTREEGKILAESRGEVDRSVGLLEFYAGQADQLSGETIPSTFENRLLYTVRAPLGPAALITPWNFPIAIPTWKSAPALLCGNTVILKPAEQAPASACLLAEVLHDAGLPPGVFNLVTGDAAPGQALVNDSRIRCISFTGSIQAGREIMRSCADRLIRIGLEMGGKNPHIVLDDADLDRAVSDLTIGAFWAAGHKCTAASRAIVLESVYQPLLDKLLKRTAELRVGDGMDPNTHVPPMLNKEFATKALEYIALGQKEGASLLTGGKRLSGGIYDEGWYISPAIFADVGPDMRIAREEIFGPVLCVIKVKNLDEALRVANDVEFGLSSGISTRSLAAALEFARRIDAGVIHVNNPTAGLELQAPFGGCKISSAGSREMGRAAIDFYSQIKTVYIDP